MKYRQTLEDFVKIIQNKMSASNEGIWWWQSVKCMYVNLEEVIIVVIMCNYCTCFYKVTFISQTRLGFVLLCSDSRRPPAAVHSHQLSFQYKKVLLPPGFLALFSPQSKGSAHLANRISSVLGTEFHPFVVYLRWISGNDVSTSLPVAPHPV